MSPAVPEMGAHVWAGTYDPQNSKVVRHVSTHLQHRMLEGVVTRGGTPGQEVKRERDRDDFQRALAQLNDGLSDLCFNMQQSEPISGDPSWPPEMDMPYPASALSSNLSKAPSVPAPRRGPSSQSSAESSRAPVGHVDKARQERPEAADQKLTPKNRHTGNTGAHDVFQHNIWVDERVDALMLQVKEAQAKLEPKIQDRNEITDLLQRLDRLERRSAVAGRRVASEGRAPSNSYSDPAVSERRLGHSPFSLPTIREAAESTMRAGVPQHNQSRQ